MSEKEVKLKKYNDPFILTTKVYVIKDSAIFTKRKCTNISQNSTSSYYETNFVKTNKSAIVSSVSRERVIQKE